MNETLLAEFCVRLASGLACMMLCTSSRDVGIQYFRTLMLVVLGLVVLALLTGPAVLQVAGLCLVLSAALAFVGFGIWTLGRRVAGLYVVRLLTVSSLAALLIPWNSVSAPTGKFGALHLASEISSAALLGSMMAAMLLGHSYLVAPTMSIDPLKRLVLLVGCSLLLRFVLVGAGCYLMWSGWGVGSDAAQADRFWWSLLGARWLIGIAGPALIAWMVWQTARIQSTQSATGILYVGVVLTFFGEISGQLLSGRTGISF